MSEILSIRGAKTHNLKNVSLDIPKNSLVVVTGVSGSGKSSLAFDTIFAEGQRRYLESLSTYARMIISSINDDTKVDEIRGLSPTIAIHQKTVSSNPRSTVGTITEIYDYFRLLFTTVGIQKCPHHPDQVLKRDTIASIVSDIQSLPPDTRVHILAPILLEEGEKISLKKLSEITIEKGFVRFQVGPQIYWVGDSVSEEENISPKDGSYLVIDRLVVANTEDFKKRCRDSLETTYRIGNGHAGVYLVSEETTRLYRENAACPVCDYELQDLTISNFSFNSHYGACETCSGLGTEVAFLEEKVVNPRLTLAEWALLPWAAHPYYAKVLEAMCERHSISLDVRYEDLKAVQKEKILHGTPGEHYDVTPEVGYREAGKTYRTKYEGIIHTLTRRYRETDPGDPFMKKISQYVTEITCPVCDGHRLKQAYLHVFVGGLNIGQITDLQVRDARVFFEGLKFRESELPVVTPIMKNIQERLEFLDGVGLGYMSLSRRANTLSGGESQRIRLATQIGTRLEGIIYVLDEPSIGLHPRDNDMLIGNIKRLVQIGNTVIVVEHDEDIMAASEYIVDIWPAAGVHGGHIVFSGTYDQICQDPTSSTGAYLSGKKRVSIPDRKRKPQGYIEITGAAENNLQKVNVRFPLGCMTVVTGVSGSGKSSLVMDILANSVVRFFWNVAPEPGKYQTIKGIDQVDKTIIIDQSPIGKTPHSNIATYTGVFTYIREVFASSLEAQKRWYGPGRFSFNTKGGRCETCEGSGVKKIEMHFLPDVFVQCESCQGSRYNPETLEVPFKGKNIAEVLRMTCEDALDFFQAFPRIARVLQVLVDVGLGYITLGQSAPTLSGGEAQRIKLAFDLSKRSTSKTLYILDEPTTGLHFSDVQKLLDILDRLVEKGNSVIIIEHNLDMIANADEIIDIGPEWGDRWGRLLYAGPLRGILKAPESYTAAALQKYFTRHSAL